ncbi:PREDICTED: uncharacterized protein LOC104807164 isoform X2 [Tarenaya hassleriana]|uniref:uncharacterized protein LOC104807164 isoform X2 n=1 Tax=Tarenaya hassleriana TaxID=28532 RepID=UPI00053C502D|nr:PREDICTED: uncharacterized protein LOC104807164 isoform X2 [Tarenaya hassleriana]
MATMAPEYPPHSTQTLDQLSFIDLSTLTQSELLALSRCSSVTASAANCFPGDTAVASIDRSAFNESVGSRRQTFCRLGPSSPSSSVHHRSRVAVAGRLSSSSAKSLAVSDAGVADASGDPHHGENRRIIANLKQSLRNLPEFYDIDFDYVPPCSFTNPTLSLCDGGGERKRKRGRKPKPKPENFKPEIQKPVSVTVAGNEDPETGLESVNKNGVRVDLAALSTLEDPYGPEIRRRTEGLCGEEELLGFLSSLGGEWCSRRRKRKIVDAGVLGDFLPVGWKLLLALKRKERRAWVYCRRIVSPGGRHLLSCKEVSEYLRSYFESHGEPSRVNHDRSTVHPDGPQSVSQINQDANCSEDPRKYHSLMTVSNNDNLKVIQVQNLFKCQKCNSTFDTNDAYLQHLISVHQENTKRCKLGSSVEGGQTITNGNRDEGVEQQYDQLGFQQTIEPTIKDDLGMRISRMDALIEIAHNSMLETSSAPPTEATERLIMFDELNLVSEGKRSVSDSEHEMISPIGVETEDGLTITNLDQGFPGEINGNTATGEKVEILEHVTNFMDIETGSHRSEAFPGKHGFGGAANGTEESVFGNKPADEICLAIPTENQEALGVSLASSSGDGGVNNEQSGLMRMDFRLTNDTAPIQDSIQFQLQPTQNLQTYDNVSKGEDKPFSINPSNELQLEYMESLKLNFVGGTDMSLVPMGLEENTAMVEEETAYGSAPQFQSQEVVLGMTGGGSGNNLTTICMWCGIEFSHVLSDSEPRSDSVGYMCLACKARISGQMGTPDAHPPPTSTIF